MNYEPDTWYNELYRLFSNGTLLTVAQTVMLGQCLRALQAGENAEYHLNRLYFAIKDNETLSEQLDEYIHAYLKHREEVETNVEDNEDTYFEDI